MDGTAVHQQGLIAALKFVAGNMPAIVLAHVEFLRQFFHPALRRLLPQKSRKTPIVFYSQVAWDTVWQRPQEEAIGLSSYRPVLFVSPIQIHELVLRLKDRWKFVRRLEGGRLVVLTPIILSGEYRFAFIRHVNKLVIEWLLKGLQDNDKFIYMTNSPFSAHLVKKIKPSAVLFDIIDDFSAFDWAPKDARESEKALVKATDIGIAGTGFLEEKFRRSIPGILYLPSGVKFSLLTQPVPEPPELEALSRPRILYVGTLNDRLNASLFNDLAAKFPNGSLVVVGPVHGSFNLKNPKKNIHFLGLKPHGDLSGYYQHCDLGIMPFADSPAAQAINPIKTLEYLACGLPVLSTPIPDVVKYYGNVVRVEAPNGWAAAAAELLSEDSTDLKRQRADFARNRDWSSLTKSIASKIRAFELR